MVTMPGATPEKFEFSVRDDAVAVAINRLARRQVVLHYQQHKFVPTSCFAKIEHYAVGVRKVGGLPTPPCRRDNCSQRADHLGDQSALFIRLPGSCSERL